MSTDPFGDIGLTQEIGQPTFVELIVAKQETGQAIRTICYDDSSGDEVCDQGPSPELRLRELAYGKKREITSQAPSGTSFTPIAPQKLKTQKLIMSPGAVQSAKAQKVEDDFYALVNNGLEPQAVGIPSCVNLLINGTFNSDLSGWDTTGDVFWQSSTTNAVLRENPGGGVQSTISQLLLVQADKFLQLDFDLSVLFEYDDWELIVEVRNATTVIYTSTIDQDDGFGTFSIGEIPPATSGIATVEFRNNSAVVLESKLLNLDNIRLCYDDEVNTLTCDAGFELIEKTDFATDGLKNWEADGGVVTDRLTLNAVKAPVDLSPAPYGVFFGNDETEIGLAGVAANPLPDFLSKKTFAYELNGGKVGGVDADDSAGLFYVAIQKNLLLAADNEIVRFNYDGSGRTVILGLGLKAPYDLAVDAVNGYIFYTNSTTDEVWRMDIDGSNDTLLYSTTGDLLRLVVDATNGHVYFIRNFSPADSNILRIDLDGSDLTIIDSTINDPRSLVLDVQNSRMFVGTGVVSGEVRLYDLTFSGTITELFSTDPILAGNTRESLNSISDIDINPNGLLYLAGGRSIFSILPDGTEFTQIYNSTDFVDSSDIIGTIHVAHERRVVARKFLRNLVPDAPVRFTALFDGVVAPQGGFDDRKVYVELARPEGGSIITQATNTDTITATFSAGPSGYLSANVILEIGGSTNESLGVYELLLCGGDAGTRPQCTASAPREIDFQDFSADNGGWGTTTWSSSEELHILGENSTSMSKVFTGLVPNSLVELHYDIPQLESGGLITATIDEVALTNERIAEASTTTTGANFILSGITTTDTIVVEFQMQGDIVQTGVGRIDNVLLCQGTLVDCRITNTSIELEWSNAPIRPVNVFEAFARYKIRNRIDSTAIAYVNQPAGGSSHLTSSTDCDFWKQQGNGGVSTSNPLEPSVNIGTVVENSETDVNDRNWVWSVPLEGTPTTNDILVITVNNPQTASSGRVATGDSGCGADEDSPNYDSTCVVESFNVVLHMNRILTVTEKTEICAQGTLLARIKFRDGSGVNHSFEQNIDLAALFSTTDDPAAESWDDPDVLGNGIAGETARWESFDFSIDNLSGTGLNQCTTVVTPTFTATGSMDFGKFGLDGIGFTAESCDPEVTITTEDEGSKTDEVQSIILPTPSGGTYDITLSDKGTTDTVTIPWNADAMQVRTKLGQLSTVGGTRNVEVTGSGIAEDPFLVTFIDQLSARDMNLMSSDDTNLAGTGEGVIKTLRDGTFNEQQTIHNRNTLQNFRVTFNNKSTAEMPWNISLDDMEGILSGLESIGTGNVEVVGNVDDRTMEYGGPWVVKFKNDLSNQNLIEMFVTSDGDYEVITDWNGGGGINELQELKIRATGGSYYLQFTNPDDLNDMQSTGIVAYNATAAELLAVIIGSVTWVNSANFNVRSMEEYGVFNLIFRDDLWGIDIPQIVVGTNDLTGGSITIEEVVKGGGSREKQRIKMVNVTGGVWRLTVAVPDIGDQTTGFLDWKSEAEEIEAAIIALPGVTTGDVSVSGEFPVYLVVFRKTLGNIDLMVPVINNLECSGFVVVPVPPPPYDYELNELPDLTPPPAAPPRLPLTPAQNIYTRTNYQRYLFDPNFKTGMTVKDIALLRGVNIHEHAPYIRTCDNSNLLPTTYEKLALTKESFVLIPLAIDSVLERQRILQHFRTHREILPMRFTWDCLETP